MKLERLLLCGALVGTLAAIGCGNDGGGGTADPCTGGQCDTDQARKQQCQTGVEYCKSLGAGGAGGAPTAAQCDAAGSSFCEIDTGTGGTGGNPGNCDYSVDQVCNTTTCDVDTPEAIAACKDRFEGCLANPPSGNFCEKCAAVALEKCGGA